MSRLLKTTSTYCIFNSNVTKVYFESSFVKSSENNSIYLHFKWILDLSFVKDFYVVGKKMTKNSKKWSKNGHLWVIDFRDFFFQNWKKLGKKGCIFAVAFDEINGLNLGPPKSCFRILISIQNSKWPIQNNWDFQNGQLKKKIQVNFNDWSLD